MEQKKSLETLLTPRELSEILGLKKSCVYRKLRCGEIPSVQVAGKRNLSLRVRPSALEKWLKERELR